MKKFVVLALVVFMLSGCGEKLSESIGTDNAVSEKNAVDEEIVNGDYDKSEETEEIESISDENLPEGDEEDTLENTYDDAYVESVPSNYDFEPEDPSYYKKTSAYYSGIPVEAVESVVSEEDGKAELEAVLESKGWSDEVCEMVLIVYDSISSRYEDRGFENYFKVDKLTYLGHFINTVSQIRSISINPEDEVLRANHWNARAERNSRVIVLKFGKPACADLSHEIAHLEPGTFLLDDNSDGIGLGFVLEEGRSSFKEGITLPDEYYPDGFSMDLGKYGESLRINNYYGSYPAFEQIYKDLCALGVDVEGLRRECASRDYGYVREAVKVSLCEKYGEEMTCEYMNALYDYIYFFDTHGQVTLVANTNDENVSDVKTRLDTAYNKLLGQQK